MVLILYLFLLLASMLQFSDFIFILYELILKLLILICFSLNLFLQFNIRTLDSFYVTTLVFCNRKNAQSYTSNIIEKLPYLGKVTQLLRFMLLLQKAFDCRLVVFNLLLGFVVVQCLIHEYIFQILFYLFN